MIQKKRRGGRVRGRVGLELEFVGSQETQSYLRKTRWQPSGGTLKAVRDQQGSSGGKGRLPKSESSLKRRYGERSARRASWIKKRKQKKGLSVSYKRTVLRAARRPLCQGHFTPDIQEEPSSKTIEKEAAVKKVKPGQKKNGE